MDGALTLHSEPGVGTTFKIYLPRVEAPAEVAAAEQAALAMRGSETVLLCEDEHQIRDLVERMLKRQGYQVLTASTPEEAIAVRRSGCRLPLILLMASGFPGETARERLSRRSLSMTGGKVVGGASNQPEGRHLS